MLIKPVFQLIFLHAMWNPCVHHFIIVMKNVGITKGKIT